MNPNSNSFNQNLNSNQQNNPLGQFPSMFNKPLTNSTVTPSNPFMSGAQSGFTNPTSFNTQNNSTNLFNQQNTQQSMSSMPQTSAFNSSFNRPSQNLTSFGQPSTTSTQFQPSSSTSLFNRPNNSTSNLFNQPNTTSSNLFNQPNSSTSLFNQQNSSTNLFNQQPGNTTSLFNQPNTSTNLFNQPNNPTPLLNQQSNNTTSNLFNQQPNTATSNLFNQQNSSSNLFNQQSNSVQNPQPSSNINSSFQAQATIPTTNPQPSIPAQNIQQPSMGLKNAIPEIHSSLVDSIQENTTDLYNSSLQSILDHFTVVLETNIKEFNKDAQKVFDVDSMLVENLNNYILVRDKIAEENKKLDELSEALDFFEKKLEDVKPGSKSKMGTVVTDFETITDKFYKAINSFKDDQDEVLDLVNEIYEIIDHSDKKLDFLQSFTTITPGHN